MVMEQGVESAATARSRRPATSPADFRAFFGTNHERMVRSLSLATGDDQLGRDAAAEGFARALARWSRVSRMDNPAGWVYRVGLNWARSRWRRTRREVSIERIGEPPSTSQTDLAGNLSLRRALDSLSTDHRDVVVARYYLDWSEAHIAEALGIKPGTVKSRLSRALDHLEHELVAPHAVTSPAPATGSPSATPAPPEQEPTDG